MRRLGGHLRSMVGGSPRGRGWAAHGRRAAAAAARGAGLPRCWTAGAASNWHAISRPGPWRAASGRCGRSLPTPRRTRGHGRRRWSISVHRPAHRAPVDAALLPGGRPGVLRLPHRPGLRVQAPDRYPWGVLAASAAQLQTVGTAAGDVHLVRVPVIVAHPTDVAGTPLPMAYHPPPVGCLPDVAHDRCGVAERRHAALAAYVHGHRVVWVHGGMLPALLDNAARRR